MIFRLTQKVSKKIKRSPTATLPLDINPFADWSANLFTANRTQVILLTNTASLYSTLMYGRGISDDNVFHERALEAIRDFMASDGQEFTYLRLIAPTSGTIRFSKALSRSVTGSMNDLVFNAKMSLAEGESSLFGISYELNEMPMSALGYDHPRKAFKSLGLQPEDKTG